MFVVPGGSSSEGNMASEFGEDEEDEERIWESRSGSDIYVIASEVVPISKQKGVEVPDILSDALRVWR